MEWIVIVTLLFIMLVGLYVFRIKPSQRPERFVDYRGSGPEGVYPEIAEFPQGTQALLKDARNTSTGLSSLSATSCAANDPSRLMELGGQYTQRTNNFRRGHPDNCSAPLTEFVESVYPASDALVPCAGIC